MINIFKDKLTDYQIEQGDILPDLNRGYKYHSVKGVSKGGVSYEEGVFLYGLVLITKPDVIVETGTESGTSTLHMQLALKHQAHGEMISVEYNPNWANYTTNRLIQSSLQLGHSMLIKDSIETLRTLKIDSSLKYLVFIDTEVHQRLEEFAIVKSRFPKGTVVAIHDSAVNYPDNPMDLSTSGHQWANLPSPRGLCIGVL